MLNSAPDAVDVRPMGSQSEPLTSDEDQMTPPTPGTRNQPGRAARTGVPPLVARLGLVLVAGSVAVLLGRHRNEIPAVGAGLRAARPPLVAVAAALMLLWLAVLARLHTATQRAAGLAVRPAQLLASVVAGHFLNLVTKSGGTAGLSSLLADGRRRRQPAGRTAAAYLLSTVVLELAFAVTLAVALVAMWANGRLTRVEVVASAVFGLYAGGRIVLIVAAVRSRAALRALYCLPRQLAARIRRVRAALPLVGATEGARGAGDPPPVDHGAADELFEAMVLIRHRPALVAGAFGHGLALQVIEVTMLWTVISAVGAGGGPVTALVAYSAAVLSSIVGLLPGGIGMVEVSVGAVLIGSGVAAPTAAAAVLLYRLFDLWLPIALGAVAAHHGRLRNLRPAAGPMGDLLPVAEVSS
jgi:uncharacterized membrane protein YbhN (UPF0104 family)